MLTPEKLKPFAEDARALGAEAFVVASYGKIVPQALLDLVPVAFNVHPSLLPLYRGATPLQSAIRDGRTQTGVTIIAMDAGMDTGDVLLQEPTPLGPAETYGELHDRLAVRGAELAVEALQRYADGSLARRTQTEVAREHGVTDAETAATATRPLRKDDLTILPGMRPGQAVDLVRSLAPSPLARQPLYDGQLKVQTAHVAFADELDGAFTPPDHGPGALSYRIGDAWRMALHVHGGHVIFDTVIAPNRGPVTGASFAQRSFDVTARSGTAAKVGGA